MIDCSGSKLIQSKQLLLKVVESLHCRSLASLDVQSFKVSIQLFLDEIALEQCYSLIAKQSRDTVQGFLQTGRFEPSKVIYIPFGPDDGRMSVFSCAERKHLEQLRNTYDFLVQISPNLKDADVSRHLAIGLNAYVALFQSIFQDEECDWFIWRVIQNLYLYEELVAVRMEDLEPRLASADCPEINFRECPSCQQHAVVLDTDDAKCLFCGGRLSFQELAGWSAGIAGRCPNCQDGWFGAVPFDDNRSTAVCPVCGYISPFKFCHPCISTETTWEGGPDDFLMRITMMN